MVKISDQFSKLIRSIPTAKIDSAQISTILLNSWVTPYAIPSYELTDNGLHFVSKSFATLCLSLVVKKLMPTAYHPQTKDMVNDISEL